MTTVTARKVADSLASPAASAAMRSAGEFIEQAWGHAGNATGTEAYVMVTAADAIVHAIAALTATIDAIPDRVAESFGHR